MQDPNFDEDLQARYRDTENEFWEHYPKKGDYYDIVNDLIPKVRAAAIQDKLDHIDYELKLRKVEDVVHDIAFAVQSNWDNPSENIIWYRPSLSNLQNRPEEWRDASPVGRVNLDRATAEYLNNPWMQNNLLDWIILNAFIFDEMARQSDGIRSGQVFGTINWAHIFSEGKYEKMVYLQLLFWLIKFVARWILIPLIIFGFYYLEYKDIAKWTAIPYAVYILVYIAMFPKRYFQRKALLKQEEELIYHLKKLMGIFQSCSGSTINPSRLRELIAKAEYEGVSVRPAVYSILDRAIQRDPAVFTVSE